MPSYLDQYTTFSRDQAELARSGSAAAAAGISRAAALIQAEKQAEATAKRKRIEAQAKEKKEVDKMLYGESFSNMADWMAKDLMAERDYYDQQFKSGKADSARLNADAANLKAANKQYQNAWKQYEGDPNDSATQSTRHGNQNALREMEYGRNPWEDLDQAPVDDYATLVDQAAERYSVLQRGKSETEVYLGGSMDESTGKWMLTFGDPNNPETWNKIDRNTLLANLEGGNAYAPAGGFKDINIPTIRELSSENQAKNFIGDDPNGASTYFRTMITGSGPAHKRFKKAVFDEMAPEFLEDQELKEQRALFVGEGLMNITYNRSENKLNYENVDPRIERMIGEGMDRFVSSYRVFDEGEVSGMTSEDIADSRLKFEMFEKGDPAERQRILKAYEDSDVLKDNRSISQKAVNFLSPGAYPAYSPDQFDNIDKMIEIPPTDYKVGSDSKVHAVALDRDGNMIAKVSTMTAGELSEVQLAAGLTEVPEIETVEYVLIDKTIQSNFFQEVGKKVNPKAKNAVEAGREHMFNTYIRNAQESPLPNVQNVEIEQSNLLPGEPEDVMPDLQSVYGDQDTTMTRDRDLARALKITFGNNPEWATLYEELRQAMNEDPSLTNKIMQGALEGRIPMVIDGEVVYETVR